VQVLCNHNSEGLCDNLCDNTYYLLVHGLVRSLPAFYALSEPHLFSTSTYQWYVLVSIPDDHAITACCAVRLTARNSSLTANGNCQTTVSYLNVKHRRDWLWRVVVRMAHRVLAAQQGTLNGAGILVLPWKVAIICME
jgi:hypothetical protein